MLIRTVISNFKDTGFRHFFEFLGISERTASCLLLLCGWLYTESQSRSQVSKFFFWSRRGKIYQRWGFSISGNCLMLSSLIWLIIYGISDPKSISSNFDQDKGRSTSLKAFSLLRELSTNNLLNYVILFFLFYDVYENFLAILSNSN